MTLDVDILTRDIEIADKNCVSSRTSDAVTPKGSKSTAKANALREAGNKLYKEKNFEDALVSYTKSVAYALEDSEELCKAYGNRSAVLFELAKYVPCLLDVNRALNNNTCSNPLRVKLLDRKERCLARMKSPAGMGDHAADDEIDVDTTDPIADQEPTWRADVFSKFGNPLLPNASPKIKLKYDKDWGRHFVATADIESGEALIVEDYFVTVGVSSDDSLFQRCDFCLESCSALIPCLSCTGMMYCSEQCRTRAYDSYHRMECKLGSLSPWFEENEAIVVRMFLIGTEQGAALENLMNMVTIPNIFVDTFDFADKPTASDYLTALRLPERNLNLNPSLVKLCIKEAVKVVVALRNFAFFESLPVDRLKNAEIFAAALLVYHFSNRWYMNQVFISGGRFVSRKIKKGSQSFGIVLLQYLFNHSCCPNVSLYRHRRENIVFANRPIKKNEQLFRTYSDSFVDAPKAERTKRLHFICRCEACSHDWPTLSKSDFMLMTRSPGAFMVKMLENCTISNELELNRVLSEVVNVAAPLLDDTMLINLRVDEIIPIIVRMISFLCKVMKPWSLPVVELQSSLGRFRELYYCDYERDPSANRSLKLLNAFFGSENDERVMTKIRSLMDNVVKILGVIFRLETYTKEGRFTKKKKKVVA